MSSELINKITLDYLLNGNCVSIQTEKTVNKKDKRFYRKRIYNLIKELLILKEQPENLSPDVSYTFDCFVNASVNYFKNLDTTDIIQEDYKSIDTNDVNETAVENDKSIELANKLMMRSIQLNQNSLRNFVTKKASQKKILILPKQREIDLKDPILKTKGIPKKNITNKYDEIKDAKIEKDADKTKKDKTTENEEDIKTEK